MSTKNLALEDAQPGDVVETDRGPATVIASADSADELVDILEGMIG